MDDERSLKHSHESLLRILQLIFAVLFLVYAVVLVQPHFEPWPAWVRLASQREPLEDNNRTRGRGEGEVVVESGASATRHGQNETGQ